MNKGHPSSPVKASRKRQREDLASSHQKTLPNDPRQQTNGQQMNGLFQADPRDSAWRAAGHRDTLEQASAVRQEPAPCRVNSQGCRDSGGYAVTRPSRE